MDCLLLGVGKSDFSFHSVLSRERGSDVATVRNKERFYCYIVIVLSGSSVTPM